jgi:Zn-finger nucleic acid-binding protein
MNCPKCKTALLRTPSPKSPSLCKQCGGMWVANMATMTLEESSIEDLSNGPGPLEPDSMTGLCPSGHGIMIRAKVDLDEPFFLEKCTTCGGIWFDRGEWLRVVENDLAQSLGNIWSKAWQRKHSRQKNRQSFLEMNHKLLGEEVFNLIMELSGLLAGHPEKERAIALLQHEVFKR